MTPRSQADPLEPTWRALSNTHRRAMLDALRGGPLTTGQIAERFPELSRFAVMQHLGVLEAGNLIVPRRVGRTRFNHLNAIPIQQIHDRWVTRYQAHWAEALVDLKDELEGRARPAGPGTRRTRAR